MKRLIIDGQPYYIYLHITKDILPGEQILYSYGVEGLPWHEAVSILFNYIGMAS